MKATEGDTVEVTLEGTRGDSRTIEGTVVVDPFTHRDTPDGATDLKVVNSDGRSYTARVRADGMVYSVHHATRRHDTRLGRMRAFSVEVAQ